jgi:hypothetical protein
VRLAPAAANEPLGLSRQGLPRPRGWSNCRLFPTLGHRLRPGDVSFEAKRFRHVAEAIPEVLVGAGLLIGDERGWLLVDFEDTQTNRDEMQALKPIRASNRARKVRERANKQNVSPTTRHCIRPT